MYKVLRALTCAAVFAASANMAHATYLVKSWLVTGTEAPWLGGTDAVFPVPTMGLDATATSGTVDWSNPGGSGTLKNFLLSDPTTTLNTCTSATVNGVTKNCATDVMSNGTASTQTATTYGQILEITGTEMFLSGTTYKITHDDGITVKLDGSTIISSPGPQAGGVSTFTTTTGMHTIDIVYGECCGNPATLMSNLPVNNPIPEPGSLELMALGVVGLLAGFRRKVWR
jgi:hypothetical protein